MGLDATESSVNSSKTEQHLKDAIAGESQANRRYLYFANKADIEGQNDVAALFRRRKARPATPMATLSFSKKPATPPPACRSATGARTWPQPWPARPTRIRHVPGIAKTARDESFDEIADWFETLAKAERSHANRYQKALDALVD